MVRLPFLVPPSGSASYRIILMFVKGCGDRNARECGSGLNPVFARRLGIDQYDNAVGEISGVVRRSAPDCSPCQTLDGFEEETGNSSNVTRFPVSWRTLHWTVFGGKVEELEGG
jgi:hypothetical protein